MPKANVRVGEVAINAEIDGEGRTYLLRPSFLAMSQLGDPDHIKWLFERCHMALCVVNFGELYCATNDLSHDQINLCIKVIDACSQDDIPDELLGWFQGSADGQRMVYRTGAIPIDKLVRLANHLLYWGIIGEPSERWKNLPVKKSQRQSLYDPAEFVGQAVSSLGFSHKDAWDLTIFEFQRAIEKEFPINESKVPPTQDEAEQAMALAKAADERRKKLNIQPRSGKMSQVAEAIRG